MENNELNFDEFVTSKSGDIAATPAFDIKNITLKQKLIAVGMVLLVLAGIGLGCWKYYEFCNHVDYAVRNLQSAEPAKFDPEDNWWYDYYEETQDSKRFAKEMNRSLEALLLPTEDGKAPDFHQFSKTIKLLDMMGWHNEDTKALALKGAQAARDYYITGTDADMGNLYSLMGVLVHLHDMTYYCSVNDVISNEEIIALSEAPRKEMLKANTLKALKDYLYDVKNVLYYNLDLDFADFITAEEVLNVVTQNAEPAVFENDKGGFYDGQHKENSSKKVSDKNVDYRHRYTYNYFGDFLISSHTKDVSSPYLNAEGNANMKKFNTSSTTMYYKGEKFNGHSNNFRTLIAGGSLPVERSSKIYTGSNGSAAVDSVIENGGDGKVLGVLVNVEEEVLCIVKSNGIAFPNWNLEAAYDEVNTDGYELAPATTKEITVNRLAMDVTDENLASVKEAFADFDRQLIGFDRENNRLVIILTAPEGTGAVLESEEDFEMAEEAFDAFANETYEIFNAMLADYEAAGIDMECMLIYVSDTDPNTVLFANLNGEAVNVIFDEPADTEEPADA